MSAGGVVTVAAGNEGAFPLGPPTIRTSSQSEASTLILFTVGRITGNIIDLVAPGCVYTQRFAAEATAPAAETSFSAPPGGPGRRGSDVFRRIRRSRRANVMSMLHQSALRPGAAAGWGCNFSDGAT